MSCNTAQLPSNDYSLPSDVYSPPSDDYSPPSNDCSPSDLYEIKHKNIEINDSEVKPYDEQVMDLMSLVKTMNTLLQNQKVLVNTLNILFRNQDIIIRKNSEMNELIKKVSVPIVSNATNEDEQKHDKMKRRSISLVNSDSNEEEQNDLPKMPFTNASEFLLFDNELQKNKTLQKKFAKKISVIGGSSFQNTIRCIMKFLMTDELLYKKFTWTGIRKTIPMNNKKLPEIIFAVVHRKPSYRNYTLKEVENVVKMWLQQARTRCRLEEGRKIQKVLQYEQELLREKELLEHYSTD